jgi:CBS domain-containing protein
MRMQAEEVAAIVDAFHFIQLLRLRNQEDAAAADVEGSDAQAEESYPNRINPDELNELDRRILKEALRQARKLQSRLELDFQL